MRPSAAERNETSTPIPAWLERAAWNAAALTVLAVMLLVLLGALEWLDRWDPTSKSGPAHHGAAPIAAVASARPRTLVARSAVGPRGRLVKSRRSSSREGSPRPATGAGGEIGGGSAETCAPPPRAG